MTEGLGQSPLLGLYQRLMLHSRSTDPCNVPGYVKLRVPINDVGAQSVTLGLTSGRHIPAFGSLSKEDIWRDHTLLLA